jgi:hypothetical protein
MRKQRISDLVKIGRAYLNHQLLFYELEFSDPPFRLDGNFEKLKFLDDALKNNPSWEVKEHLLRDNKEDFRVFSKGAKESSHLDKTKAAKVEPQEDSSDPDSLPPKDDLNRVILANACKHHDIVRLFSAYTREQARRFRLQYEVFQGQFLEDQVCAINRKVVEILNGLTTPSENHLIDQEAVVRICNSKLANPDLVRAVVVAHCFIEPELRSKICTGKLRSPVTIQQDAGAAGSRGCPSKMEAIASMTFTPRLRMVEM